MSDASPVGVRYKKQMGIAVEVRDSKSRAARCAGSIPSLGNQESLSARVAKITNRDAQTFSRNLLEFMKVRAAMQSDKKQANFAKPSKSLVKNIGWFVAFVAAFVAVKEAKAMDDMPAALAMSKDALKQSVHSLAKESGSDKADTAAGQFIGFYLINVRSRHDYCKALGVDISAFTNEFVSEHKDLYAKSRVIHARSPYTPDQIESELFSLAQPTFKDTIGDAMSAMAKRKNMSEKDICVLFATNGKKYASEMHLSKINPTLFQAMSGAR